MGQRIKKGMTNLKDADIVLRSFKMINLLSHIIQRDTNEYRAEVAFS